MAPEGASLDLVLQNAGTYRELDAASVRRWLAALARELAPQASSLGVRLCGDRAMRAMNRDFRGRDYVTDVLSFPGSGAGTSSIVEAGLTAVEEVREAGGGHLGDVVVCVPEARRQASARGESLDRELRRLLLHGVLHCMGHDHETDQGDMEQLERKLRRRWL